MGISFPPYSASFGYQINGNSILAGDVASNTKDHLPNIISYTVAADAGVTRRVSVSVDFLGQTLHDEKQLHNAPPVTDFGGISQPDTSITTGAVNQASIATGGKINQLHGLLITAGVLFRVNNAGLHYKPVPMAGLAYSF